MAKGKKSFIVYSDWKDTFYSVPDEVAGKLIKHIFAYVNDENPETDDYVINGLFASIKNTLKRDLKKWENQHKQRIEAGKKSAEIRKRNSTLVNARSISSTVNVSVSDNVDINIYIKEVEKSNFYLENFYRKYKLRKGSAKKLLEEFKLHCNLTDKKHNNFSEFKKHFNNWVNTQESNKRLEKYKENRRGSL